MAGVPPIAAVVLDLDDTVFDQSTAARAGVAGWLAAHGLALSETIAAAWFTAEAAHHVDWVHGRVSFAEHRRRRLREVLPVVGLPVGDDDALDAMFDEYLEHHQGAWRGFDDVESALAHLHARGLATAVLTNGTQAQQRAKLERIALLDTVGPVFTAQALRVGKPSPQAFATVCASLGLAPGSVLHVGDNHALDVVAARAAGLRAVHLDRTSTGPLQEQARITTLADLADHLDRLDRLDRLDQRE